VFVNIIVVESFATKPSYSQGLVYAYCILIQDSKKNIIYASKNYRRFRAPKCACLFMSAGPYTRWGMHRLYDRAGSPSLHGSVGWPRGLYAYSYRRCAHAQYDHWSGLYANLVYSIYNTKVSMCIYHHT
jgi:hypothetical protein